MKASAPGETPRHLPRRGLHVLVATGALLVVILLAFALFVLPDESSNSISVQRLNEAPKDPVAVNETTLAAEAPELLDALERAAAGGQATLSGDENVARAELYLRNRVDRDAGIWYIQFRGGYFAVSSGTS